MASDEDTPLLTLVGDVLGADPATPRVAVQTYGLPEIVIDDYGERQFKLPDATVESMLALLEKYAANHSKFYLKGEARWEHNGEPRYKMEVWGPWEAMEDPHLWLLAKMSRYQGWVRPLDGKEESYRRDGGSAGIYMDPDAVLTVMTGAEVVGMYTPQLAGMVMAKLNREAAAVREVAKERDAAYSLHARVAELEGEVEELTKDLREAAGYDRETGQ